IGQTARGIPVYRGKLVIPEADAADRILLRGLYEMFLFASGAVLLARIFPQALSYSLLVGLTGAISTLVHILDASRSSAVRRRFGHLASIEALSTRYSVPEL